MDALEPEVIKNTIRSAVEPLPSVFAMWEGGSAAWERDDAWSDIDLHLLVEDGFEAETIGIVDEALSRLSPIDIRYAVPQPTWHGHEQVFYRLHDAGEFRLVDLAVMRRSNPNRFLERERHGLAKILFDKTGEAQPTFLDREDHSRRLAERLHQLSAAFPLFQSMVKKELLRGNPIGAVSFYYPLALQPLITLLRIRYCPDRFDFGPRYAVFDLPPEIVSRIEPLWFIRDGVDLQGKRDQVEEFFYEILGELLGAEGIG